MHALSYTFLNILSCTWLMYINNMNTLLWSSLYMQTLLNTCLCTFIVLFATLWMHIVLYISLFMGALLYISRCVYEILYTSLFITAPLIMGLWMNNHSIMFHIYSHNTYECVFEWFLWYFYLNINSSSFLVVNV